MYENLNGKIESLNAHARKLDVQIAQTAESVRRQEGFLPGKTDANPKQYVNVISLETAEEDPLETEEIAASVDTDLCVDQQSSLHVSQPPKQPQPVPERVYIPRIPYPKPPTKPKVPIPSVAHQEKAKVPEAKVIAQPTLRKLQKLANSGQFVIPCSIKGVEFKHALCDTGATVNVISQAVAKKLGILKPQPSRTSIELVDASSRDSKGFVADLMLQVGDCLVPVDFHIMEMKRDVPKPLILGSSFLETVGAVVDFPNKRISFSYIDKEVFYPIVPVKEISCSSASEGETLDLKPSEDKRQDKGKSKQALSTSDSISPTVERKRTSKPFAQVRIRIPLELQDKGEEAIRQELQRTIELFPRVRVWELQGGLLVAKGKHHGRSKAKLSQDEGGKEPLKDPPDA